MYEGVQRSESAALAADVIIVVTSAVDGLTEDDRNLIEHIQTSQVLFVLLIHICDIILGNGITNNLYDCNGRKRNNSKLKFMLPVVYALSIHMNRRGTMLRSDSI